MITLVITGLGVVTDTYLLLNHKDDPLRMLSNGYHKTFIGSFLK